MVHRSFIALTFVVAGLSACSKSSNDPNTASGKADGGDVALSPTDSAADSVPDADAGALDVGIDTGPVGVVSDKCPTGWLLVWNDEFDGPAKSEIDTTKWDYDFGPKWYNAELQYYSKGSDNAWLDGNGNLVIEARKEAREGDAYTSARIKTQGKKTFTYGHFESRIKLPAGVGLWPAFWLYGDDGKDWPDCGEIDIMESKCGGEPGATHGAMHGPGYAGARGPAAGTMLPDGGVFSDDFHVFAIDWAPDSIKWYLDGRLFSVRTKADTLGGVWVFNHPFFIILNLAVGGNFPGNPTDTTVFPEQMVVDYVRVCQR
jgi:beta-glucanase (GH16 family)